MALSDQLDYSSQDESSSSLSSSRGLEDLDEEIQENTKARQEPEENKDAETFTSRSKGGRTTRQKTPPNFSMPQNSSVTIHTMDEEGNKATFLIHKALICHHSEFFRAAFNSDFLEGQSNSMDFTKCSTTIFGLYQNWLYTQKLTTPSNPDPLLLPPLSDLIELYLLADKVLSPSLQNLIVATFHMVPTAFTIKDARLYKKIYKETTSGNKLRKYLVDSLLKKGLPDLRDLGDLPKEMLVELLDKAKDYLPTPGAGAAALRGVEEYMEKE